MKHLGGPKQWLHEFVCRGCDAHLAAEPKDVWVDEDVTAYITCSVCGTCINIKVPPKILDEAIARRNGR